MKILGIETSCDETGIAIYDSEADCLLSHVLFSQIKIHAQYGGIVPELASRDHVRKTIPLIEEALAMAGLLAKDIDAIAYTAGPGLVGALLVGATIAKSLGFAWQIPTIAVHHMEAHLLAPFLEPKAPTFPFVALLVSGGHTQLVQVDGIGQYCLLGESLDDAVGEAFDKIAKLLGLGYPGGAALSLLAEQGDPKRFYFPRPMLNRPDLNFSFSGLKTFAMNTFRQCSSSALTLIEKQQLHADIARAFQDAVVETLVKKCKRALKETHMDKLVIAGGVSANKELRNHLQATVKDLGAEVYFPRLEFCTDNGAMIAYAGWRRFALGYKDSDMIIRVFPRWKLGVLCDCHQ